MPPTAKRILAAAQDILAERGYAELTITAISRVSGVNRALVSYYFGLKAGLLAALTMELAGATSSASPSAPACKLGASLSRAEGEAACRAARHHREGAPWAHQMPYSSWSSASRATARST